MSPDLMSVLAADQDIYGKPASELLTEGSIASDGTVTGTFHYVTGYSAFNLLKPEEQEGYYFPFVLGKTGETMTFQKNGVPVKENISWEANNVFRIASGDTWTVLVDEEEVATLNFSKARFIPKG